MWTRSHCQWDGGRPKGLREARGGEYEGADAAFPKGEEETNMQHNTITPYHTTAAYQRIKQKERQPCSIIQHESLASTNANLQQTQPLPKLHFPSTTIKTSSPPITQKIYIIIRLNLFFAPSQTPSLTIPHRISLSPIPTASNDASQTTTSRECYSHGFSLASSLR